MLNSPRAVLCLLTTIGAVAGKIPRLVHAVEIIEAFSYQPERQHVQAKRTSSKQINKISRQHTNGDDLEIIRFRPVD